MVHFSTKCLLVFCLGVCGYRLVEPSSLSDSGLVETFADHNLSEVRYLLWTRSNPASEDYFVLELEDLDSLEASPFNDSRRTYFLCHGWGGNGEEGWILDTKTNILTIEDSNIISVDYTSLVAMENYLVAVENMYMVANQTADYIDWFTDVSAVTTDNIHVIGHSLGGQTAGMIGKYVTAGIIDRITGLDPAGPLFYEKSSEERIDKSDASFVDVIHSNSCPAYGGCYGLFQPTGHVDFYPNGGSHQPGCTLPGNVTGENWLDMYTGCSHARSHDYFVESILAGIVGGTELTFVSWPCADYETFEAGGCPQCEQGCLQMGFHVDRGLEGSYYLTTNRQSPFAKGDVQN